MKASNSSLAINSFAYGMVGGIGAIAALFGGFVLGIQVGLFALLCLLTVKISLKWLDKKVGEERIKATKQYLFGLAVMFSLICAILI